MPASKSIFFDEWQKCLHAHYLHVVRSGDEVTEPTLRGVLLTTGLSEADLDDIRAEALASAEAGYTDHEAPPAGDDTHADGAPVDSSSRAAALSPQAAALAASLPPETVDDWPSLHDPSGIQDLPQPGDDPQRG